VARMETEKYPLGSCPCGKGKVVECSTDYVDYSFGPATKTIEIDCNTCDKNWRIDGDSLVNRASFDEANDQIIPLENQVKEHTNAINSILIGTVRRIYDGTKFRNRKEAYEEANRVGLFNQTIEDYKRARRNTEFHEAVNITAESQFFIDNASMTENDKVRELANTILSLRERIVALRKTIKVHKYR
jgi:hypothetical protein